MAIAISPLCPFLASSAFCRSLSDLSATRGERNRCLRQDVFSGEIAALRFDDVKAKFCRMGYPRGGLSADALLMQGDRLILVEFKTSSIGDAEFFRKIYDSAILLVENGVLSWDDCRRHLVFCLVQSDLERYIGGNYATNLDRNPRSLEGQVVDKVYRVSPEDFDRMARSWRWRHGATVSTCVSVTTSPCDIKGGPSRNAVYPVHWTSPYELPFDVVSDAAALAEFLKCRAERFVRDCSSCDEIRVDGVSAVEQLPDGTYAMSGDCRNSLDATGRWHVAVFAKFSATVEAACSRKGWTP